MLAMPVFFIMPVFLTANEIGDNQAKGFEVELYGPTTESDTLWRIGRKVFPEAKDNEMIDLVKRMYKENSHAFRDGDMNYLLTGHYLNIPKDNKNIAISTQKIELTENFLTDEKENISTPIKKDQNSSVQEAEISLPQQFNELAVLTHDEIKNVKQEISLLKESQSKIVEEMSQFLTQIKNLSKESSQFEQKLTSVKLNMLENRHAESLTSPALLYGFIVVFVMMIVVAAFAVYFLRSTKKRSAELLSIAELNDKKQPESKLFDGILEKTASEVVKEELMVESASLQDEEEDDDVNIELVENPIGAVEKCTSHEDYIQVEKVLRKEVFKDPSNQDLVLALFNVYAEIGDRLSFRKAIKKTEEILKTNTFLRMSIKNLWKITWPAEPFPKISRTNLGEEFEGNPDILETKNFVSGSLSQAQMLKPDLTSPSDIKIKGSVASLLEIAEEQIAKKMFKEAGEALSQVIEEGDINAQKKAKDLLSRLTKSSQILEDLDRRKRGLLGEIAKGKMS